MSMHYIDYIQHSLYAPDTYHRRYDFDLPEIGEKAKRVFLAILPFIGFYRPAGTALSFVMNSSRTVTHIQNALEAEGEKKWVTVALEVGKAAIAFIALANTVVHFSSGLAVINAYDAVQGLVNTGDALRHKEWSKAAQEAMQTLASIAFLVFMATGSLEALLIFALIQAALSFYEAYGEFTHPQGCRLLEGCGKLAMAGIRLYQVNGYYEMIQRRNELLQIERIHSVFLRVLQGRKASHLVYHPLSSLKERIETKEVILSDGLGGEHSFGAHFHELGQALVKGENLAFRTVVVDGHEMTELDFKVNHAFRNAIGGAFEDLKKLRPKELSEVLKMAGSHADGITFTPGTFFPGQEDPWADWMEDAIGKGDRIQIGGLGEILIGTNPNAPNLYDRVIVRMDPNKTLFDLHEILALVNLNQALCLSTQDDIERLKMGHLFRTFFPREATPFERSEEFFTSSLSELKEKMIAKAPEMRSVFETYFDKMKQEPLFEGRIRYRIDGLAEAAYEKGARALTAAITGVRTDDELFDRVVSMLQMGMLSSEVRQANQIDQNGLSGGMIDYYCGGADSVFTQLLTEKNCVDKMPLNRLYYQSKVRMLISLDALETGTYQYHEDGFGGRHFRPDTDWDFFDSQSYADRENILEFIEAERSLSVNPGHEVMLKERIAPSFFKGLIVPDEQVKKNLLLHLERSGLVQDNEILGHSVDQFIRVGTRVTEELIG